MYIKKVNEVLTFDYIYHYMVYYYIEIGGIIMDFISETNRIYLNDTSGNLIAEVTFPEVADKVVNINHTFVDDSLRGQGVAGQLIEAVVKKLKDENKKAYATCSYAAKWFEKHPEYDDLHMKH
jgi:predicted GNAT family acetyltransferase